MGRFKCNNVTERHTYDNVTYRLQASLRMGYGLTANKRFLFVEYFMEATTAMTSFDECMCQLPGRLHSVSCKYETQKRDYLLVAMLDKAGLVFIFLHLRFY